MQPFQYTSRRFGPVVRNSVEMDKFLSSAQNSVAIVVPRYRCVKCVGGILQGIGLIQDLITEYGLDVVQAYMNHIQACFIETVIFHSNYHNNEMYCTILNAVTVLA